MKRGDIVLLSIDGVTPQGDGSANAEGRQLAVRGAVPGDEVLARVRYKRKGRVEADVEKFEKHGTDRRPARCQHFGVCGGCRWQDLPYVEQLRLKSMILTQALVDLGSDIVRPILPSATEFDYRNKMEFSFGLDREGHRQLGLHVRGRYNRVFDLESCSLQSEVSNAIVAAVRRHADELEIPIYDLHSHEGVLRFLVVRDAKVDGRVLVNLVVADFPNEKVGKLVAKVIEEIKEIETFLVTLHQGKGQVATGQREFVLRGSGSIIETCAGLEFEISSRSFFQTNPVQAGKLYGLVGKLASEIEASHVLDLYCGVGAISLCLARVARFVTGVELEADAVANARENATRNGITNCDFISGRVEEVIAQFCSARRQFDVIVLDPPRAGLHEKALEALVNLGSKTVIYVSCNPISLGKDLRFLSKEGFSVDSVYPVDMFPQTPHCEAVALMKRKS